MNDATGTMFRGAGRLGCHFAWSGGLIAVEKNSSGRERGARFGSLVRDIF